MAKDLEAKRKAYFKDLEARQPGITTRKKGGVTARNAVPTDPGRLFRSKAENTKLGKIKKLTEEKMREIKPEIEAKAKAEVEAAVAKAEEASVKEVTGKKSKE